MRFMGTIYLFTFHVISCKKDNLFLLLLSKNTYMNATQTKELMDDLRDQIINRDYLTYKIDEAIQERNLNKIVAHYVMREELSKVITMKASQLQNQVQLN